MQKNSHLQNQTNIIFKHSYTKWVLSYDNLSKDGSFYRNSQYYTKRLKKKNCIILIYAEKNHLTECKEIIQLTVLQIWQWSYSLLFTVTAFRL